MGATHGCICADLNLSVTASANDHSVNFFEGDEIVNFTLLIAILVDWVDY